MRRLSDHYPDYRIDVAAEQAALVEADIVVLQYPTHWFNTPAILKKWLDDVWTYGFAYGTGGDKLHGKKLFVFTTTGAPQEEYDGSTTPPSTFRAYTATRIWHKSRRVPTITPAISARKSSNCGKRSHIIKKQPFRLLFYGLWHQRRGIKWQRSVDVTRGGFAPRRDAVQIEQGRAYRIRAWFVLPLPLS